MTTSEGPPLTSRFKRSIKIAMQSTLPRGRGDADLGSRGLAQLLDNGLTAFESAAGHVDDKPVFILSAGWRSGSTLLQRLVVSSGTTLVWGEPFNESSPVQNLMRMLPALDPDVFTEKWVIGQHPSDKELVDRFIANLFPPKESLVEAHRAFVRTLFGTAAEAAGYRRWGIKEVRWGHVQGRYLRALFPEARIVFLVRNPYDSYASYVGSNWYWNWPDEQVTTATQFGTKWSELAGGFRDHAAELGALLVTYEDLLSSRETVEKIEDHLDLKFDPRILGDNLGLSTRSSLDSHQIDELRRVVEPVADRYGYMVPSNE